MIDVRRLVSVRRDVSFEVGRQAELDTQPWLSRIQAMRASVVPCLFQLSETPIAWWSALITLCLILVTPLTVVDVPPLLDYPNHLARTYVLAHGQQDAHLSQIYAPHWAIIPNLAVDLILPPLLLLMPVHTAGRILLAVALVLPVIGSVLYSQAVFMRRSYWSIAVCLVACNGLFLLGFLNFQLAVGLALASAAAWLRWRETRPGAAVALGVICAVLLFFSHLMGLLFFLILLISHEIERVWDGHQQGDELIVVIVRRAAWLLPVIVLPAVLYTASTFADKSLDISWEIWPGKLVRAVMSLINYNLPLDIITAGFLAVFLLTCARLQLIMVPLGSVIALGATAILFMVSPLGFKGTGYVDARFAVMFGFLIFAAILPVRLPKIGTLLAGVVMMALFGLRTAETAAVWHAHNRDLDQLRSAISVVEPGSRVLLAAVNMDEAIPAQRDLLRRQLFADGSRLDSHTAALLLIERHAFWPFLFANQEQQPIKLRSPYLEIVKRSVGIPNVRLLSAPRPEPSDVTKFPLQGQWSCCYDYVLLLAAAGRPDFYHDNLELLYKSDYASLFRIKHHVPFVPISHVQHVN
jgi:hypothetical protein